MARNQIFDNHVPQTAARAGDLGLLNGHGAVASQPTAPQNISPLQASAIIAAHKMAEEKKITPEQAAWITINFMAADTKDSGLFSFVAFVDMAAAILKDHFMAVRDIINRDKNAGIKGNLYDTPYEILLCLSQSPEMTKLLLSAHANPLRKDEEGKTAFDHALRRMPFDWRMAAQLEFAMAIHTQYSLARKEGGCDESHVVHPQNSKLMLFMLRALQAGKKGTPESFEVACRLLCETRAKLAAMDLHDSVENPVVAAELPLWLRNNPAGRGFAVGGRTHHALADRLFGEGAGAECARIMAEKAGEAERKAAAAKARRESLARAREALRNARARS